MQPVRTQAPWVIAGLISLGIPQERAITMISDAACCDPGTVPGGVIVVVVQVCRDCVAASEQRGLEVGPIRTGVPQYGQKS